MIKKLLLSQCFVWLSLMASAQIDYATQYQNGKDLFRKGQYNLAMETFKPLITYDEKNQYSPYASFYYALAAYKQGYEAVAKDMLLQIKQVHPRWDKMKEVDLWLATVYLDGGDYFQGIKILNSLEAKDMAETIRGLKRQYLSKITDTETLRMMLEEFPKDEVVGRVLAEALAKDLSSDEEREALEEIIERFKFERSAFIPEAPESFHKERYAVSLLLPFMLEELDASPGKKRNQIVLDFYEGIKLALDSLNKQGPQITLRAYDTDQGLEYLKRILQTEELKNSDLVIGPLFSNENDIVQQFSLENQVNVVNPFSNNTDLISGNPFAFLFQPSAHEIGDKAAEYVAAQDRRKTTMVFFEPNKKDSVLAASYIQKAHELGLQVVASQMVTGDEAGEIITLLATPTEFDEFKYPTEFSLKKDSIGSIYVATDKPLIYTKVISAVETRGDSILVVGSENWIDDTAVPFEKYQTLGVVFTAPNYVSVHDPALRAFASDYIAKYGKAPSNLSRLGYELMLFFGGQLKKNGVYFQDGLSQEPFVPGDMFQGFKYEDSRNNQLVPIVKFEDGVLILVDPDR